MTHFTQNSFSCDRHRPRILGRPIEARDRFPTELSPNESQTEDDLIWPVLARLGWTSSLSQQNLSARGREDVPDGLLFADGASKDRANRFAEEWKRYEHGLAVVESKRWLRPLDRRSGRRGEESAPSTQMLRYLRRIDDLTTGKLRWGILTNGARWRLYYAGARSVSEQFFEIDLAAVLDVPGNRACAVLPSSCFAPEAPCSRPPSDYPAGSAVGGAGPGGWAGGVRT